MLLSFNKILFFNIGSWIVGYSVVIFGLDKYYFIFILVVLKSRFIGIKLVF